VAETCAAELMALTVALVVPEPVGVPETNPVLYSRSIPAGRLLAAKLVGVLVAVIW